MAWAQLLRLPLVVAVLIVAGVATNCTRKVADAGKVADATKSTDGASAKSSAQGSDNTKGPDDIVTQVRERIAADPNSRSKQPRWRDFTPKIQVSIQDGIVKLTGTVATDDESNAAGNDAAQVEGVQFVANYLVAVGGQRMGTQTPTHVARGDIDAAITTVLQKIRSDPRITGKIQVGFDSSTESISLRGRVASDEERTAAGNDATEVTDLGIVGMIGAPPPGGSITAPHTPPAPWSDSGAADRPSIPLCPGLTVVTAIASQGDYESIKTIESANSKEVRVKYTSEVGPAWWTNPSPQARHLTSTHRTVLTSDLESAHAYDQIFVGTTNSPETAPGTTAIGTSAAVLRELKTKGETEISICGGADDAPVMDANGQLHPVPGGCYNFMRSLMIKRAGNEPAHVRVLVNGVPVDLPAVQARGETGKQEFFFLDDERNPLTLAFRLGIGEMSALNPGTRKSCEEAKTKPGLLLSGPISCDLPHGGDQDTLRAVKITTDCAQPAASASSASGTGPAAGGGAASTGAMAMEKSLAETGKVDVYSIYFSFNSDVLREESEPTLKEIAEVLRRHRDWKLRVAGHTDGIGGDEQNLDLSKRRAAAVKDALVKRYGIAAGRLSTTGFGKSQPKDTNDTLEGRGHNRRVELMKIS